MINQNLFLNQALSFVFKNSVCFKSHGNWRKSRPAFILCMFLFLCFTGYAQNPSSVLTGVVKDQTGAPLEGASVKVKGENLGTLTDKEGKFSLHLKNYQAVLIVTHIGFALKELPIAEHNFLDIQLKPELSNLNDVVVIGYAVQKKATLTGAVEQITSKTFESRAVTNVGLALQGETPGLVVTRTSPRPGNEGLAFQIRGATSINGGSPLIVIDGVPALNSYSFNNMNSDDIESISVLKDGSASIYGSRAANGVILVTTKRSKGKLTVDYSGDLRFTSNGITGFSPSMQQYASMWIKANEEETVPYWWGWVSLANMQKMQQGIAGIYPTTYWGNIFLANSDRISEMFTRHFSNQHTLSLANRTEAGGYRLSFGYAENKGNLATAYDGQKQYNARFNYDYKLTDRLKMETNLSVVNIVTKSPSVGLDAALYAEEMPLFPAKNPFGEWYADYGTVGDRNPAAATADGGRDNIKDLTLRGDSKLTYKILDGLDFEGTASFQNERYNDERWVIPVQTYDWYGNKASTTITATQQSTSNPGYRTVANTYFYQYYSALLRYSKKIHEDHNISIVAGINAEKSNYQLLTGAKTYFTDLGVEDINVASDSVQTVTGGKSQSGIYSYIASLNYNYKEKYLLQLQGRRDGNSKFASGYKFKNFGSVLVGWVFSKEKFFDPLTRFVDFGKLRLSYGSAGNDVGLGNFDYLSTVSLGTIVLGSPATLQQSSSLSGNGLISYTRTWEKVVQKNVGIDLTFLRSRLAASFDYFIKDNEGMLSSVKYASVLGGSAPTTNSGHMRVKGWELSLSWKDSYKDFNYNVAFNLSNTQNHVSDIQGHDDWVAGKNSVVNNYPTNSWFVYKTNGLFKDNADVADYYAKYSGSPDLANLSASSGSSTLRPGDVKKVAGPLGTITSAGDKQSALVYKGDGNVHYNFGFNFSASWKGIDFAAFFQGQFKQMIMRSGWMAYPFVTQYTNQNPKFLGKTWTSTNTGAKYPRLTVYTTRSNWNYANNDFMLQNNKYIRLKSLIIGYTLPRELTKKVNIQKVRVFFSGNDLWEWTHVKDGFDPEMGETSQNVGYPFYRTWSFGFNVGF